MRTQSTSRTITTGYLLLFGALLFLWPVVAGLPGFAMRATWIAFALPLLQWSAWNLEQAMKDGTVPVPRLKNIPWIETTILLCAIAVPLAAIPFHAFSDEPHMALPTLALLSRAADAFGWLPLIVGAVLALIAFLCACMRVPPRAARVAVLLFAGVALFTATEFPAPSPFAVRYPPLVHLFQSFTTLAAMGDLTMLRMTNLFWTVLLVITIRIARPAWSRSAVIGASLAVIMTPLGWMYRTALYQACGEITLGMGATFLLANVIRETKNRSSLPSAFLALLLSLWMLYRPTSAIAFLGVVALLLLLRRWREAGVVAGIAGPVVLLWIALYPAYNYSFLLQNGSLFPAAERSLTEPFLVFLRSFPGSFGVTATAVLLLGSLLMMLRGDKEERWLLMAAWIIALPPTLAQQFVLPPDFYGFPRYTVLLLLPLGVVTGSLLAGGLRMPRTLASSLGFLIILLFAFTTPWRIDRFMQENHRETSGIYRSVPGADVPLPVFSVAETALRTGARPIILSPDYTFLDLFVPGGLLTTDERRTIIEQSAVWTPTSSARPVLVQAPIETTYQPNITAEQERRLKEARVWALAQPGHRVIRYGIEETVLVP